MVYEAHFLKYRFLYEAVNKSYKNVTFCKNIE